MNRQQPGGNALCRLLYTSRSTMTGTAAQNMAAARDIAHEAAKRNHSVGLTGTLLFADNSFTQVLEGPPDQVESVFEAICRDFRHEDVKLIDFSDVRSRLFDGWDMAIMVDGEETAIPLREGLQEIRFMVRVNAEEALRQIRALLDQQAELAQSSQAA